MEKIKMVEYCGEMVPAELCTIDREGGADDFVGCGVCFNDPEGSTCENCVVNRIFKEYARLTGQLPKQTSRKAGKVKNRTLKTSSSIIPTAHSEPLKKVSFVKSSRKATKAF